VSLTFVIRAFLRYNSGEEAPIMDFFFLGPTLAIHRCCEQFRTRPTLTLVDVEMQPLRRHEARGASNMASNQNSLS